MKCESSYERNQKLHLWKAKVALDVSLDALVCCTALGIARLFAENAPVIKAMKVLTEALCVSSRYEVDEGIAET